MEIIITSIVLVIIGGALNGSFAIPMKHMPNIKEDKLWFVFSWWGFLIIPLITFFILDSNFIKIIFLVPPSYIIIPLLGGIFWGFGMIFMSLAFRYIGIGAVFVINIGIGTAGGALLPLVFIHPDKLFTTFGGLITIGVILFIIGVISASIAAKIRDKAANDKDMSSNHSIKGVIFSIIAGFTSAFQGFSYAYGASGYLTENLLSQHNSLLLTNLPWCLIFVGGFFPYMIYFLIQSKKKKATSQKSEYKISFINHILIVIMGLLYFECVIFYSKATLLLGALGPIIIWPIYMVFIVITSNFWGFMYGEWKGSPARSRKIILSAIGCQLIAVAVLAIAAFIN